MIQNLLDGYQVFHARNNPDRALAALAGFDVDVEHPFQSLSPIHRHMTLGEAAVLPVSIGLLATLAPARGCDQSPVLAIWRKHTVEAGEVDPWLGYQGSQSRHEIKRLEDHMCGAVSEGSLELITYFAGRRHDAEGILIWAM